MMAESQMFMKFKTDFKAIRVIENRLIPTKWRIKADILIEEEIDDLVFNYISLKIRFWLDHMVRNAVIFSDDNDWAMESFFVSDISNPLMMCPGSPSDDLLSTVFHAKLNSLGEKAVKFGAVELASNTSGGIGFIFVGDSVDTLPDMKTWMGEGRSYFDVPWWARDDASTFDILPGPDDDLAQLPEFAFKLDFLKDTLKEYTNSDKDTPIIKPEFKPKVIQDDQPSD